jgi:hypothetical protein
MINQKRPIELEINSCFNGASVLAKVNFTHVKWMGPLRLSQQTQVPKGIGRKLRRLEEINRPEKQEI